MNLFVTRKTFLNYVQGTNAKILWENYFLKNVSFDPPISGVSDKKNVTWELTAPAVKLRLQGKNNGWNGNFANGDSVLHAQNDTDDPQPIRLRFVGTPVFGVGAQIQPDRSLIDRNELPIIATIRVFLTDGSSKTYEVRGISDNSNDNSAPFAGVISNEKNISEVEFNVRIDEVKAWPTGLAINFVSLKV